MNKVYNIFISYRTDTVGQLISQRISEDLKRMGYSVYHNSDRNHKGYFDERLRKTIEGCRDFLLVLSKECLEKLLRNEAVDWVREEILCARKNNKNIIPVLVDGTKMPKDKRDLPEELRFLVTAEAVTLPVEYNKLPPLQMLIGKLDSPKGESFKTRNVYNSNEHFKIDDLFLQTKELADTGDRKAMYELASFYYYGYGHEGKSDRDYKSALSILKELSEGRDEYASYANTLLARMYYGGFAPGESQSYEKSFQYHQLAASVCNYSAHQYAFMLSIGSGCDYDFNKAEKAFLEVNQTGDNVSIEGLARLYLSVGKYKEAAKIYQSMSSFIQDSEYQLGMMYKKGVLNDPPEPDYFRAAFYFQHMIGSKHCGPEVYYQLATLYFNPTGGFPKDFNAALKYFSIAAEMGHVDSSYMLGYMYEYGHVRKDLKQAIEYHSRAADQGNYLSAVHLAFLYQQEGYISYDKAYYYARSAAEHGVMEGEFVYGILLLLGRGCEPDSSKAVEYLKKAFEHGIYQAKFFLDQTEKLELTSIEDQHSEKTQYYHFKSSFVANDRFSGRDKELEELRAYLKESRVCFVSGIGGIGKTELVRQYASENMEKYDRIIFMKYTSDLTDMIISDQYFEIDGFVRKTVSNEPESDDVFCRRKLGMIKKLLSGYSLLIIDNFDTEYDPMLKDLLDGPYQVILTTRMNYEHLGYPVLTIDRMSAEDQLKLFYKYSNKVVSGDDLGLVRKIVSGLNGHTLTIELVAKQFAQENFNVGKIMGLVQTVGINAITNSASENDSDGTKLINEYICQLFREEKLSVEEKTLLLDMSLLPISGVSLNSFMEWCEVTDKKTVEGLIEKSWLQYDPENGIVSMHPLIVEMIKNELGAEMKLCETMLYHLDQKFSRSYYMKAEERNVYGEIAKALYQNIPMTKENLNSYRRMFWVFKDLDWRTLCQEIYDKAIEILGEEDSIELAWWYWDYGDFTLRQIDYDKALKQNRKAIGMLEIVYPDSYDLAYFYKHEAHIYHAMYDSFNTDPEYLKKALQALKISEKLYNECLKDDERSKGSSCYSYARDLSNDHESQLASRLFSQGLNYFYSENYSKAEEYSLRSLEIFERINGRIDADTTAPMLVLARIYSKTGRHDEAIITEKEVLNTRRLLWGAYQLRVLSNYEILADFYMEAKRKNEAIKTLKQLAELLSDNPLYADYLDKIRQKIDLYKHCDNRKDHQEV